MLTKLREQSQSFLIYILFGILIVVFIFFFGPQAEGWQPGQVTRNPTEWAARVGELEAPRQEVTLWMLRQERFGLLDDQQLSDDGIRREAATQVLEQLALEDRARKAGMRASDNEVTAYITSKDNPDLPLFSDRGGNFEYKSFQTGVTQGLGATIPVYRRAKERELVVNTYVDFLASQLRVPEPAVKEAWARAKLTWNLEYVQVNPEDYADQGAEPTLEEGSAWAAAHAKEVSEYYEANKKKYDHGKELRVSRLLKKVPADGGDEAKAKVRAELDALRAKAQEEGTDFAALVQESSEGAFKDQGGDMGWQVEGNADYAFFASLEAGQVSEIKDSPFGLWFVKVTEVKPAVKKSLEEAKAEIGQALAREGKKQDAAKKVAEEILAQLKAGKSFAEAAPPLPAPAPAEPAAGEGTSEEPPPPEPRVKATGAFSADRPDWNTIPGIGESPALAARLDALTAKAPLVGEVLEIDGSFFVVRLTERVEPDEAKFAEERGVYETRLRRQLGGDFFGRWSDHVFGWTRNRLMQKSFGGGAGGALLASLPQPGEGAAQLNETAFPKPAAPAAAAPGLPPGVKIQLPPN